MIKNIGAVLIWSENWRELANWYRDILELEVESELSLPDDTGVNFIVNGTYFWVGAHDQVHSKSKDKYRIMVGFDVDSVQAVYDKLKPKGVEFILEPSQSPTKTFFVATAEDPDGNIIQFYSNEL
jgi:predicted enzyme related to lactoylglutathione lyase